jgi:predicted  nucleic acid-binding Zn-ribbon protein
VQQQKISKLRDQMLQAKTNEQYKAFQHEIEFCGKEIRKSEDKILELMGESETLEKNVKGAESRLKAEKQSVEAEKKRAEERTAADQRQLEELLAERKQAGSGVTPAALKSYERIRKKVRGGVAITEATEGRCGQCQMLLRPQFFQDLKASNSVMFCECCGRILFYNPPVVVDEQTGPAPMASA